jgi:hypothetical protein
MPLTAPQAADQYEHARAGLDRGPNQPRNPDRDPAHPHAEHGQSDLEHPHHGQARYRVQRDPPVQLTKGRAEQHDPEQQEGPSRNCRELV